MSSNVHDDDVPADGSLHQRVGRRQGRGTCLITGIHGVSGEHSWNAFVEYADEIPSIRCSDMIAVPRYVTHRSWRVIRTSQADAIVAIGPKPSGWRRMSLKFSALI